MKKRDLNTAAHASGCDCYPCFIRVHPWLISLSVRIPVRPAWVRRYGVAVTLLQRRDGVPIQVVKAQVEHRQLRQPRRTRQRVAAVVLDEVAAQVELLQPSQVR